MMLAVSLFGFLPATTATRSLGIEEVSWLFSMTSSFLLSETALYPRQIPIPSERSPFSNFLLRFLLNPGSSCSSDSTMTTREPNFA